MSVVAGATLQFAREVRAVVVEHGTPAALIGAAAMAVHGYVRATGDVDLAVVTDLATLRAISRAITTTLGAEVTFDEPDEDDPLGGVLTCRLDGALPVQVVNFVNERRVRNHNPGLEAIRTSSGDASMPVVDLPHLIALKLWAGGPKGQHDVRELLAVNADADLAAIDDVCHRFDLDDAWRPLRPAS